jgi:ribokinase
LEKHVPRRQSNMTTHPELLKFLQGSTRPLHVVLLPDFFLDRIINLDRTPQDLCQKIEEVVQHKGGSVDGVPQVDLRGGNAINVASALAALGAKVTVIVCTSILGRELLQHYFKTTSVDISRVKVRANASITTALEFATENGKTNVMIRDVGSLADFGPADLTESDYHLVEEADYVCVFNWAGTLKHGTELAQAVFRRAKAKGKAKTYLDTADPTPNSTQLPELKLKVLQSSLVDILSVNENEAVTYASLFGDEVVAQRGKIEFGELALLSAQVLAKHLAARIDLHTTSFSVTVSREGAVLAPAFKVKTVRATGAGDAWDAANIFGDANNLSTDQRLTLANAAAACYLSDAEGVHPTRQKLAEFLKKL